MKRTLRMLFKPALQWLLKPAVKTQLEGYLSLAVIKGFNPLLCLLVLKRGPAKSVKVLSPLCEAGVRTL